MVTILFITVLAVLIFLSFTGPNGITGSRSRH